ncbi:hypothetical protein [Nocardia amamiensis]|uniref:hypothetical protein n=1 Tax=Nocardia amamiensis TaxID=404578 RepID=UPI00082B4991|nr:hypothetical protein [Nocardia amamiensis]
MSIQREVLNPDERLLLWGTSVGHVLGVLTGSRFAVNEWMDTWMSDSHLPAEACRLRPAWDGRGYAIREQSVRLDPRGRDVPAVTISAARLRRYANSLSDHARQQAHGALRAWRAIRRPGRNEPAAAVLAQLLGLDLSGGPTDLLQLLEAPQ